MPLPSIALAAALTLCFANTAPDANCAPALGDAQLAKATGGDIRVIAGGMIESITQAQGRDQVRTTGSIAEVSIDIWWFEQGLEIMARGRDARRAAETASGATLSGAGILGTLLTAPEHLHSVVTTPGGTATIDARIHLGEIRIDGRSI